MSRNQACQACELHEGHLSDCALLREWANCLLVAVSRDIDEEYTIPPKLLAEIRGYLKEWKE